VSRWIVVTLVASIVAILDGGFVMEWASLAPARVWHGELWRLVTWPLVEPGPISLVITCLSIFKFGGELSVRWGDRRLLRFVGQIVLASGVDLLLGDDPSRLKQCPAPDGCGWLFYDASKNATRRWCSMRMCGNGAKARRFQRRQRGAR